MNYELAKELKDVGFPQDPYGPFLTPHGVLAVHVSDPEGLVTSVTHAEGASLPTLSELIEACGERFGKLVSPTYRQHYGEKKDHWVAMSDDERTDYYDAYGSTPEEAVAKLYIALNKK